VVAGQGTRGRAAPPELSARRVRMAAMKARKTRSKVADIAGAERKLRQAEFFLWWLEDASKETAHNPLPGGLERLEFLFSACLSAAKSVYYILTKTNITGRKFKDIEQEWVNGLNDDPGGSRFERMKDLRDDDVHFGETGTKPLQKYIEDNQWRNHFPYHHSIYHNAALFGPQPINEMENPDGKKVKGSVLRGTVGLYLDRDGGHVEATTACSEFIEQLRSLLKATKAAFR